MVVTRSRKVPPGPGLDGRRQSRKKKSSSREAKAAKEAAAAAAVEAAKVVSKAKQAEQVARRKPVKKAAPAVDSAALRSRYQKLREKRRDLVKQYKKTASDLERIKKVEMRLNDTEVALYKAAKAKIDKKDTRALRNLRFQYRSALGREMMRQDARMNRPVKSRRVPVTRGSDYKYKTSTGAPFIYKTALGLYYKGRSGEHKLIARRSLRDNKVYIGYNRKEIGADGKRRFRFVRVPMEQRRVKNLIRDMNVFMPRPTPLAPSRPTRFVRGKVTSKGKPITGRLMRARAVGKLVPKKR